MIKDIINFEKLITVIKVYVQEAERCGEAQLYFASCVMFGATLEACLFAFLLSNLDDHEQPGMDELKKTKFFNLIDRCKQAGVFRSSKRVKPMDPHQIRVIRNLIHPIKLLSSGELITRDIYLNVRDTFHLAKEHLLYWLTGDLDIEDE